MILCGCFSAHFSKTQRYTKALELKSEIYSTTSLTEGRWNAVRAYWTTFNITTDQRTLSQYQTNHDHIVLPLPVKWGKTLPQRIFCNWMPIQRDIISKGFFAPTSEFFSFKASGVRSRRLGSWGRGCFFHPRFLGRRTRMGPFCLFKIASACHQLCQPHSAWPPVWNSQFRTAVEFLVSLEATSHPSFPAQAYFTCRNYKA